MRKLGEILIDTCNDVSAATIDEAMEQVAKKGDRIGETLIKMKAIDEIELIKAFAEQFSIEFLTQLPAEIQADFTAALPIHFLKRYKIIPVVTKNDAFIATSDPTQLQPLDDIRRILDMWTVPLVLCPQQVIVNAINYAYDMTLDTAEEVMQDIDEDDPERLFTEIEEIGDLIDETSESPVVRLVNLMFSQAVRDGASDIHIEPYQNSLKVRQRLDGILYDMFSPPKHVQSSLVSRVKIMAKLDIAEKRLPQDGRIELKVSNKEIDVRVSTLPTAFGERVVLRLLDKSSVLMSMAELGMPQDRLKPFSEQIKAPNGIILVTGPTGSGKTTTLYAALNAINSTDINIITVEDPIEYRISGIGQVQVNPKINLTFASGLRSIVRQDPDVILVGEIRDTETAEIAIQSALTGHLVFSTLHTNDAASAVTRLRDMGVEPFLIASSINAILAQRLVRVLCEQCKTPYSPSEDELHKVGIESSEVGSHTIYRESGCSKCYHSGYKGRRGIFELLLMTQEMKRRVITTADANELKEVAEKNDSMISLKQDGARAILDGITTIEEVYRVCQG